MTPSRKPDFIWVNGRKVSLLLEPPCPAIDPDDGRRCALPKGHAQGPDKTPHKHEEDVP